MKVVLFILIPIFIFSKQISEKVEPFSEVIIDLNARTKIKFGKEHHIQINGKKSLLKKIDYEIKNDRLVIEMKRDKGFFSFFNSHDEDDVEIVIYLERLEFLKLNGAGKTTIDEFNTDKTKIIVNGANDLFTGGKIDDFKLIIHGASEVELNDLVCKVFSLDVKGAGDLRISGRTDEFDVEVKGAGDVMGYRFKTNYLNAKVMGAGDIRITVEEEINASIFGAGSITYKGNPVKIKDKIFGAGSIERY